MPTGSMEERFFERLEALDVTRVMPLALMLFTGRDRFRGPSACVADVGELAGKADANGPHHQELQRKIAELLERVE